MASPTAPVNEARVGAGKGHRAALHVMSLATQALARTLCAMLYKDGADLTDLLVSSGILEVQEGGHYVLNRKVLKRYFVDHVVVCEGHCVNSYWPRGRDGEHIYKVCTCINSALHAECEHVKYAGALCGGPPNLNSVPESKPRGRKRKQGRR